MQTTRKIAARVSGPITVCGRTISFSSFGASINAISIQADFLRRQFQVPAPQIVLHGAPAYYDRTEYTNLFHTIAALIAVAGPVSLAPTSTARVNYSPGGICTNRDGRDLLQPGGVSFSVGFAFAGCDLLDGGSCRRRGAKILRVHIVKRLQVRQIVEIDICGYNLIEIHVGFFKVVEKIGHGLPELMLCGRAIDAAVRTRNEAVFCGAI